VFRNDQMNRAETEMLESFIARACPGCSSPLSLPVTHNKAAIASDSDYGRTKDIRIIHQYSFSIKDLNALNAGRYADTGSCRRSGIVSYVAQNVRVGHVDKSITTSTSTFVDDTQPRTASITSTPVYCLGRCIICSCMHWLSLRPATSQYLWLLQSCSGTIHASSALCCWFPGRVVFGAVMTRLRILREMCLGYQLTTGILA
jgi:hypothetical protein